MDYLQWKTQMRSEYFSRNILETTYVTSRWAIWREIWKWSCIPSLLYCISRKNVDTEYTYYSWCMTSTDIVKWRKNEWLKYNFPGLRSNIFFFVTIFTLVLILWWIKKVMKRYSLKHRYLGHGFR
jgi:hypothetical protein